MEDTLSQVRDEVLKSSQEGHITCAAALAIARTLNVDPRVVGRICDDLHIRVRSCSLGLFE
ncbi:MAG TPA: hypothetical protein PLO19_04175 [Candidatus Cryosericum sp.]|nr:hypothetical protein [Candidatus Cryosericum sp.]HPS69925.1 hypothetical protein [Candidatus Cryosericum sp.]